MSEETKDMPKVSSDMEAPKALNYIEKLVAELCPDGVEYVEISELFDTKNGYTPSKSIPSYWQNGEIPWFRMEDIRVNGRVLSDSLKHVHKSAVKNGKIFPQNSIIFARVVSRDIPGTDRSPTDAHGILPSQYSSLDLEGVPPP